MANGNIGTSPQAVSTGSVDKNGTPITTASTLNVLGYVAVPVSQVMNPITNLSEFRAIQTLSGGGQVSYLVSAIASQAVVSPNAV
jgi:hypothetical protein